MFNIFFLKNSYVQLKKETSFQDINMVLDIEKGATTAWFQVHQIHLTNPFLLPLIVNPLHTNPNKKEKKTKTAKSNK